MNVLFTVLFIVSALICGFFSGYHYARFRHPENRAKHGKTVISQLLPDSELQNFLNYDGSEQA